MRVQYVIYKKEVGVHEQTRYRVFDTEFVAYTETERLNNVYGLMFTYRFEREEVAE